MIPCLISWRRRFLTETTLQTLLALIAIGLLATGCSRGGNRPIVHPVKGRVMLEGQPLEGVGVSFSPFVKGQGVTAFGKTRADGSFTITSTLGGTLGAGAVAGEYAVMLQKLVDVAPDAVPPEFSAASGDPSRSVQQWFSKQETTRLEDEKTVRYVILGLLPEAYGKAETSGLRVTVKPGTNSGPAFEFDLQRDFIGATPQK
jgi:hypothetical protein